MAVKYMPTFANQNEYFAAVAESSDIYKKEDYEKLSDNYKTDFNKIMSLYTQEGSPRLDKDIYDRLYESDNKFEYLLSSMFDSDEDWLKNKEIFNQMAIEGDYRRISDSISPFEKALNTVGSWLAHIGNMAIETGEGLLDLTIGAIGLVGGAIEGVRTGGGSFNYEAYDNVQNWAKQAIKDTEIRTSEGLTLDENLALFDKYYSYGDNDFARVVTDITTNLTRMSLNLIPVVGQALYFGSMAGNTLDSYLHETSDKDSLSSLSDGFLYTSLVTGVEFLTEHLVGDVVFGKGLLDINPLVSRFDTKVGRILARAGLTFVSEGLEESSAEVLDGVLYNWFINGDNKTTLEDVIYAGVIGGLVGIIADGVTIANVQALPGLTKTDTFILSNLAGETYNKVDASREITKLRTRYANLNLEQLKLLHPEEFESARNKDAKRDADLIKSYTVMADFANKIGLEKFKRAGDLLAQTIQKKADMARAQLAYQDADFTESEKVVTDLFNQYISENTNFLPKREELSDEEYKIKTNLGKMFPGMTVVFGTVTSGADGKGKQLWSGATIGGNIIFVDSTYVADHSVADISEKIIAHELIHNLQRDGFVLSKKSMDKLDKLMAEQGIVINYDNLEYDDSIYSDKTKKERELLTRAEKQAEFYAPRLLFDGRFIRATLLGDSDLFAEVYKWANKKAKTTTTKNQKGVMLYNILNKVMNTYEDAIIKEVSNNESVDVIRNKIGGDLLTDEDTEKIYASYQVDRYDQHWMLVGKNMSSSMSNLLQTLRILYDNIKTDQKVEDFIDLRRLYDITYYDESFVDYACLQFQGMSREESFKRYIENWLNERNLCYEETNNKLVETTQLNDALKTSYNNDILAYAQAVEEGRNENALRLGTELTQKYKTLKDIYNFDKLPAECALLKDTKIYFGRWNNENVNGVYNRKTDTITINLSPKLFKYDIDYMAFNIIHTTFHETTHSIAYKTNLFMGTSDIAMRNILNELSDESLNDLAKNILTLESLNKLKSRDDILDKLSYILYTFTAGELNANLYDVGAARLEYFENKEGIHIKKDSKFGIYKNNSDYIYIDTLTNKVTGVGDWEFLNKYNIKVDTTQEIQESKEEIPSDKYQADPNASKFFQGDFTNKEGESIEFEEEGSREAVEDFRVREIKDSLSRSNKDLLAYILKEVSINKVVDENKLLRFYNYIEDSSSDFSKSELDTIVKLLNYISEKKGWDTLEKIKAPTIQPEKEVELSEKTKQEQKIKRAKESEKLIEKLKEEGVDKDTLTKLRKERKKLLGELEGVESRKSLVKSIKSLYNKLKIIDDKNVQAYLNEYFENDTIKKGLDLTDLVKIKEQLQEFTKNINEKTKTELKNVSRETKSILATVAPYYNTKVTKDNFNEVKNKVDKAFKTKANEIANLLGVEITDVYDNIGSFEFQEGDNAGTIVNELSYTFNLNTSDTTKADLFASLMGDLGYEQQEAVISANYLEDENISKADAIEIKFKLNNTENVNEELKEIGIKDYTLDLTNKELKILNFNVNDINGVKETVDKINNKLGDNVNGAETRKIESRYLDRGARENVYRERLQSSEISKGQQDLRIHSEKIISQAYEKLTGKKFLNETKSQSSEKPKVDKKSTVEKTKAQKKPKVDKSKDKAFTKEVLKEVKATGNVSEKTIKNNKDLTKEDIQKNEVNVILGVDDTFKDSKSGNENTKKLVEKTLNIKYTEKYSRTTTKAAGENSYMQMKDANEFEAQFTPILNDIEDGELIPFLKDLSDSYTLNSSDDTKINIMRALVYVAGTVSGKTKASLRTTTEERNIIRDMIGSIGRNTSYTLREMDYNNEVLNPVESAIRDFENKWDVKVNISDEDTTRILGKSKTELQKEYESLEVELKEKEKEASEKDNEEEINKARTRLYLVQDTLEAIKKGDNLKVIELQYRNLNEGILESENQLKLANFTKEITKKLFNEYEQVTVKGFKQMSTKQKKAYVSRFANKIKDYRFFSMLSNPSTWINNYLSNNVMKFTEFLTRNLEKIIEERLQKNGDTTTQLKYFTKEEISEEVKQFVSELDDVLTKASGGNKYDSSVFNLKDNQIKIEEPLFKNEILNWYPELVNKMLNSGDKKFVKDAIVINVQQILQANMDFIYKGVLDHAQLLYHVKSKEELETKLKNSKKQTDIDYYDSLFGNDKSKLLKLMPEGTRDVLLNSAISRAYQTYFRNANNVSKVIQHISETHPWFGAVFSVIMPFPKVATNIMTTMFRYSPFEWVNVIKDYVNLRKVNKAGQLVNLDDYFAKAKLSRSMAQATIGTFNMILGSLLAALGKAAGFGIGKDRDDDYALFISNFSIKLSRFDGVTGALAIGGMLEKMCEGKANLVEDFSKILYDYTLLGNLNDLIVYNRTALGYAENIGMNWINQYIPSVVRSIAKVVDPYRKNKSTNVFLKFIQNTLESLPGLSYLVPNKVDPYTGMNVTKSGVMTGTGVDNLTQIAYSLLIPFQWNAKSDIQKECERVEATTTGLGTSFTYNGVDYNIPNDKYTQYAGMRANYINNELSKLFASNSYKRMSDDDKAKAIKLVYTHATELTKTNYWTTALGNYRVFTTVESYNLYKNYLTNTNNVKRRFQGYKGSQYITKK